MILRGTVHTGRGEAAGFLAVPWVDRQLKNSFGLTPHPGTLNLRLEDRDTVTRWDEWQRSGNGQPLRPPEDSGFCAAIGYPVEVGGRVAGVIVRPQTEDYPATLVEVVAAENLRQRCDLTDGDVCRLLLLDGPRRLDCVLFDLEGTLVDFQWQLAEAESELRAVVGDLGFDASLFTDDNYAAIRRRALELASSPELRTEIDRRLGPVYDRYDQDALSRWSLREGARELLEDLRGCGIHVGLVSNIGRTAVAGALKKFGLAGTLDVAVTRNEAARMKPDGDGIRRAMAALGATADRTLMVGDSMSDLGAARDAGVAVAILAGGESSPAEIAAGGPDHQLRSLAEVEDLL